MISFIRDTLSKNKRCCKPMLTYGIENYLQQFTTHIDLAICNDIRLQYIY